MRKPDEKIADSLFQRIKPELEHFCHLMIVSPGVKPEKGQAKAEALCKVMLDFLETIYKQALATGYDMGHHVFANHGDK
jgi:hypothetical protein